MFETKVLYQKDIDKYRITFAEEEDLRVQAFVSEDYSKDRTMPVKWVQAQLTEMKGTTTLDQDDIIKNVWLEKSAAEQERIRGKYASKAFLEIDIEKDLDLQYYDGTAFVNVYGAEVGFDEVADQVLEKYLEKKATGTIPYGEAPVRCNECNREISKNEKENFSGSCAECYDKKALDKKAVITDTFAEDKHGNSITIGDTVKVVLSDAQYEGPIVKIDGDVVTIKTTGTGEFKNFTKDEQFYTSQVEKALDKKANEDETCSKCGSVLVTEHEREVGLCAACEGDEHIGMRYGGV